MATTPVKSTRPFYSRSDTFLPVLRILNALHGVRECGRIFDLSSLQSIPTYLDHGLAIDAYHWTTSSHGLNDRNTKSLIARRIE